MVPHLSCSQGNSSLKCMHQIMMKLAKNLLWYGVITASRLPSQDGLQHKAGHDLRARLRGRQANIGRQTSGGTCVRLPAVCLLVCWEKDEANEHPVNSLFLKVSAWLGTNTAREDWLLDQLLVPVAWCLCLFLSVGWAQGSFLGSVTIDPCTSERDDEWSLPWVWPGSREERGEEKD